MSCRVLGAARICKQVLQDAQAARQRSSFNYTFTQRHAQLIQDREGLFVSVQPSPVIRCSCSFITIPELAASLAVVSDATTAL
jgi:hypothetical protein